MGISLTKVRIENFRSIESLELSLSMTNVLIGANNCGKSNFLKAVNVALGQNKTVSSDDIYIGKDEVQSIALAKVPGAASKHITKLKLKLNDGSYVYEVEIVYDNIEYDFEIDAYSGTILSWESETIRN